MILNRYMSFEELLKLLNGETITRRLYTNLNDIIMEETSIIHFIGEEIEIISPHNNMKPIIYKPEDCYVFLLGIVSENILVKFETDETIQTKTALYADPHHNAGYDDIISVEELYIDKYNIKTFKPIKFAVLINPKDNKWKWVNSIQSLYKLDFLYKEKFSKCFNKYLTDSISK